LATVATDLRAVSDQDVGQYSNFGSIFLGAVNTIIEILGADLLWVSEPSDMFGSQFVANSWHPGAENLFANWRPSCGVKMEHIGSHYFLGTRQYI
jgi:hypothetical protein